MGGDDLTVNANGAFTFATALLDASAYSATVLTQPTAPNQTCIVTTGAGTLAGANVTNVAVDCTTNTYPIDVNVTGLQNGAAITLQNNGGDDLVVNADGSYTFSTQIEDLLAYDITVLDSLGYLCTVSNGTGNVAGAGVNNIGINCISTAAVPTLSQWAIILLSVLLLLVSLGFSRKHQRI